ncbi:DUF1102 domain-containing protein [Halorubrum sp. CGM5_25_10-8B]|uniref:CARDB domain-containing protein n=1 Tax=Halorubrum sp. CGM5_25_10-8B TaxID=2518115 RepID=UPI0010F990F1|nr:CARDB domain-containing protein [Halorubrum sp. CGM5_25_10-8B]TKX35930.1 DUF1102 domain-containing protein [Halorubrum sp. CGM5_25_10-8B]
MFTTRRTLTLALLLVAAGSLAFATGAVVIDGDADTVADGDLAIQPADGPNGRYAYLNDANEIAIDVSASNPNIRDPSFDGVNVDTTGRIDNVFTITYTADQYAHVWIGDGSENVTFVAGGDSIEGEANNVTLAPNETVSVGLAFDARGATAGTRLDADEFSIEAKVAEPDEVEGTGGGTVQRLGDGGPTTAVASPSADRREFVASGVESGAEVRFRADGMPIDRDNVTLEGIDLAGVRNDRVELNAAGSPVPFANGSALTAPTRPRPVGYLSLAHEFAPDAVDAMTIRLSADRDYLNATGTDPADVTLYRQTDAGDWEAVSVEVVDEAVVDILGLPEDRVHFRATTTEFSTFAVATREPRFDVTAAAVSPEAIDPGENVTVRATVRNGGGAAGERAVPLTVDGNSVASEMVALAPNETATLSFDETVSAAGAYDLAVGGTPAGTLLVGDPGGDPAGGEGSNSEATGGDGESAETASGSDAASSAADTEAGPTEEPGGIEFVELGGLLAALALAVAGLALFRRMPRS